MLALNCLSAGRGIRFLALAFCSGLLLPSCATKSAYTGHRATDLSSIYTGAAGEAVESAVGPPEKTDQQGAATIAWYVYDRGFIGSLEESSAGEKMLWAPVMAWGEVLSLGLAGWMTACQTPCQKGWLVVRYDQGGHVVEATESFLPDDHPLVADCARSAVRADVAVCGGVREKVRPSSLPALPLP